jgi:dTDP-L-rhamnose 4-epimerase
MNVLITGGAGFIGSHLADRLIDAGCDVTLLDNLDPQVHGGRRPAYLNSKARLVVGDVRRPEPLRRQIRRAGAIFHLAASVGVGQSQYDIRRYVENNVGGTAHLLDLLATTRHRVRKLLVAGSMSAYGEGAYRCARHGRVRPAIRAKKPRRWDPPCPDCGGPIRPVPTREDDRLICTSVYAVTKLAQEELVLNFGRAYDLPAVALRFFNVYGPRQSLSNPYTGVAAIFISRVKNRRPPVIYEDGEQTRDFIHARDVAECCRRAMERAEHETLNVATGAATSVRALAERIIALDGAALEPKILRAFRRGDVRHCVGDATRARRRLGWSPRIPLDDGLCELMEWSREERAVDRFDRAQRELTRRGLA